MADGVRIEVEDLRTLGRTVSINRFSEYEISSSLWSGADNFTIRLHPDRELRRLFKTSGQQIKIYNRGHLQFEGRVDDVDRAVTPDGTKLQIQGRDYAGFLIDAAAPLLDYKGLTFLQALQRLIEPWDTWLVGGVKTDHSLARLRLSGRKSDTKKSPEWRVTSSEQIRQTRTKPGDKVWDVITRLAKLVGAHPWVSGDTLYVARPNYDQKLSVYAPGVVLRADQFGEPAGGNVRSVSVKFSDSGRFSDYTIRGQGRAKASSQGIDITEHAAVDVIDPGPPFRYYKDSVSVERLSKVDVQSVKEVQSSKQITRLARQKMERNALRGFTHRVEVWGHEVIPGGPLWAPDTMIPVDNAVDEIKGPFYVLGRDLRLDLDDNETTALNLLAPNIWLAVDLDALSADAYERTMRTRVTW